MLASSLSLSLSVCVCVCVCVCIHISNQPTILSNLVANYFALIFITTISVIITSNERNSLVIIKINACTPYIIHAILTRIMKRFFNQVPPCNVCILRTMMCNVEISGTCCSAPLLRILSDFA